MLRIDGAYGEGGGQILRTSLTLALLTGKAFELINIRAKRPKPGLRPQHLTCVKAAQKIGHAEVQGARVGSLYLRFVPQDIKAGDYRFDVGTAGATGLVFQTVALPLAHAGGGRLLLRGGTHVPYAPCFHYLDLVYKPLVARLGYEFMLELLVYGFYPQGGGEFLARVGPRKSPGPLVLSGPFSPQRIEVYSVVTADLPGHILKRQAQTAVRLLEQAGFRPEARLEQVKSKSTGTMVFVYAEEGLKRAGFMALGKKGKPAERVAAEAVKALLDFLKTGAALDPYISDQILLPAVLSGVEVAFESARLTRHFFTNLWVIRQFLPEIKVDVDGQEGSSGLVRIAPVKIDTYFKENRAKKVPGKIKD